MKLQKTTILAVADDAIVGAIREAVKTAESAHQVMEVAVNKAMIAGQLLREKRATLADESFSKWLEKHVTEISRQTAYTWMNLAEYVTTAIDLPACGMPLSQVLSGDPKELPESAREAQQLMFDFTEGKSIRGCLRDAVLDGEESRLKRAFNGRTKGGSRGEDRKNWAEFIGRKLSDISSHLEHWEGFTPGQREKAERYFALAIQKWPTALVETLQGICKEEGKKR